MNTTFSNLIDLNDTPLILQSKILNDWLLRTQKEFEIKGIHFEQVDFVHRSGVKQPLFIKLKAEAYDSLGRKANGITLLRGHAVAIAVMIECENEWYTLLVCQPRLGVGQVLCPEIPAGMMDTSDHFEDLAIKELKEETGLDFNTEDLIDLLEFWGTPEELTFSSTGLIDEGLKLFAAIKIMTRDELNELEGKCLGAESENEFIQLKSVPLSQARFALQDSKSMLALLIFEQYLKQQA
jgi:8-oxo-dGTP pyrophosphatase MutT (NUDIX family)